MVRLEQVTEQQRTCGYLYLLQASMHYPKKHQFSLYIAIENTQKLQNQLAIYRNSHQHMISLKAIKTNRFKLKVPM